MTLPMSAMTITNWLSPEVMRPAGWALLHFVWQGTALAALAAVAMALFRRASARYLVAVSVLVAMLAAPVATFFLYRSADAATAAIGGVSRNDFFPAPAAMPHATNVKHAAGKSLSSRLAPEIFPFLVQAWLLGVAFFSLRSAGGVLALERMRRRQSFPATGRLRELCVELQQCMGLTRAVRFCQCAWLEAPAVIGWFRPVVFLPVTALTGLSETQLQAVIAHELAHVKRLDSFVNALQVVTETLLFYHPAVWWLNKRIRLERENCCDDAAIALCGNAVEYARALTLMEEWRAVPALAMAVNRGPLSTRIMRLLGINHLRSGMRGAGLTASVFCLTVALVAGNAVLGIAGISTKVRAQAASAPSTAASPATPEAKPAPRSAPAAKPSPARASTTPAPPTVAERSSTREEPVSAGSYIEGMKAAGLGDITVDQLVALKIQGVTPEYVRGIQALGIHPDVDDLIGMKVQGVTPEYIRDLRDAGVNVSEDEIIGMKVQGVTAEYVKGMQQAGIQVNGDDIIAMKVQGVSPAYVLELKQQGIQTTADEIVGMKVQGVTPEYVRQMRALGLNPTADELVGMRVQGITPEYVKSLQAAGFKFDVDELISAKVQGITPEFLEKVRKHGFKDLHLEKLIQLKNVGVLDGGAEL